MYQLVKSGGLLETTPEFNELKMELSICSLWGAEQLLKMLLPALICCFFWEIFESIQDKALIINEETGNCIGGEQASAW